MLFIQALKQELSFPMPGVEFQMKMAPTGRFVPIIKGQKKIEAAVAIILYWNATEKEFEMILTKRPEYDGPHSGQVSFPGGKVDRSDNSMLDTAIRETHEEIGIQLVHKYFLGKLTPLHILVSGFEVHPYVFFYPHVPEYSTDPQEVHYIINTGITSLLDESIVKVTRLVVRDLEIEAPYYAISGEIVWGATAMIISEFTEILQRLKLKNPVFRNRI